MTRSIQKKQIAKAAFQVFGGKPSVVKYWDDQQKNDVDILSCPDRPQAGVTSYSTIGLSDASIGLTSDEVPLRVEIVGACGSAFAGYANVLATCAFDVMEANAECRPGAVLRDAVAVNVPDVEMKHVWLVPPFLWEEELKTLEFPSMKVAWLLAVPISEAERAFAEEQGAEALESLFEEKQIDLFDLRRASVL